MPGARDGHSSCVIRDKMFIFGGYEERVSCYHIHRHRQSYSTFALLTEYILL